MHDYCFASQLAGPCHYSHIRCAFARVVLRARTTAKSGMNKLYIRHVCNCEKRFAWKSGWTVSYESNVYGKWQILLPNCFLFFGVDFSRIAATHLRVSSFCFGFMISLPGSLAASICCPFRLRFYAMCFCLLCCVYMVYFLSLQFPSVLLRIFSLWFSTIRPVLQLLYMYFFSDFSVFAVTSYNFYLLLVHIT